MASTHAVAPGRAWPGGLCRRSDRRAGPGHGQSDFLGEPGPLSRPGEFACLPEGLPALVVQPIGSEGLLLLGGWSPRCFSRSDELWLEGWALKLRTSLEALPDGTGLAGSPQGLAGSAGT
jgi:hypothetical protein